MASSMEITFPGGVAVDAQFEGTTIRTDQPVRHGGGGTAPAPFELFLASIGTCAGFYAFRFCQERQIPTEGCPSRCPGSAAPRRSSSPIIRIQFSLPPGFPEKYRTAVVRAADQCTVKKHLVEAPAIEVVAV